MKIGAGGLQSQIVFELDQVRREGMARGDHQVRADFVPEVGRVLADGERLVRFVEQLNAAATLANYPFRFRVRQRKEGAWVFRFLPEAAETEEEVSSEELAVLWQQLQQRNHLDENV
ncbi:hypothetical protein [Thermodesulfitimonas sp.]